MKQLGKAVEYPYNLISEIFSSDDFDGVINNDMINGLNYVLKNLSDEEQEILRLRFEEKQTYRQMAKLFSVSHSCVSDRVIRLFRKLRHPKRNKYVIYGLEFTSLSESQKSKS